MLQILYNLISNAFKFTERGIVEVTAALQGDAVAIQIRDSGIGIPKEHQTAIFESFHQAGVAVNREYGGAGLGLAIAKQLAERSGGALSVRSEPGRGSVFTVTLPVSKDRDHRHEMAVQSRGLPPATAAGMPELAAGMTAELAASDDETPGDYTILAVDDDPANLQVIRSIFAGEPCRILIASDGEEALRRVEETPGIDLAIVDVMMPKLSGYEVTRRIRERYALSDLPILLVTVRNDPEDLIEGFSAGANDFLTKPFHIQELKARVRTLLNLKRSVEQLVTAELDVLRAKIKPHFLFNALNTVIGVCVTDPDKAVHLLTEFSDYLRGSFDFHGKEKFVPLERELELVRSYAVIEEARFEERLRIDYRIDETVSCRIPPLTIQPLVENAIRHGVMKRLSGGTVRVEVRRDGDGVRIEVSDDGVGIPPERQAELLEPDPGRRGVGLINIHQRMRKIYGTGLSIVSEPGRGTRVTLVIPKGDDEDVHDESDSGG